MRFFKKTQAKRDNALFAENRKRVDTSEQDLGKKPPRKGVNVSINTRKVLKGGFRLVFAVAIVAIMSLVVVSAYHHATTSPYFAFKKIDTKGAKRLSENEILETANLVLGMNIFEIDLVQTQRKLLDHPWISEVTLKRRLPGNLSLQITERRAVAVVNLDVLYLLDDTGEVFKRWSRGDPVPAPIITGVSREQYNENPNSVKEIFESAIDLATRYRKKGLMKLRPLEEIHHELNGAFSLTLGGDPTIVKFGKGPYRVKLARLSTLLRKMSRDGKRPAVIYFDNQIRPDRITVRLKTEHEDINENQPASHFLVQDAQKRVSKI